MKLETDNRRLVPSSLYPLTIVLTELVLVFHNFSLAYNIGLNRPHRQLKMSTAYAVKRAVGKLVPSQTAFLLCDVQERFVPLIHKSSTVVHTTRLLTSVSKELSIPLVVTEQYKKVFGPTHGQCFNEPLTEESNIPIFEKKLFSMITPEVRLHLQKVGKQYDPSAKNFGHITSMVLFGIEAHVCVLQTCLDLLEMNIDVHVVVDACSSMKLHDREIALERMRQAGAYLTTAQSLTFQLLQTADHPKFKAISQLIKHHAQLENEFNVALMQQYGIKQPAEDIKT